MAAKKTPKKTGKELATWEKDMLAQAEVAADMEAGSAGGQFFSVKDGVLTLDGAELPNNEMAVVILDSMMENVYYKDRYDPNNISGPVCFAFGYDEKDMKPHNDAVEAGSAQSEVCSECAWNEWASADTGKGKACRNTRRLALITAGTLPGDGSFEANEDKEHFKTTAITYLRLPVTSVRGYAGVVRQLASASKRPPHAMFTRVKVVSDSKTQYKVVFEPLKEVPNALMPLMMERHEEAKGLIDFPYSLDDGEGDEAPAKGAKKPAKGAKKPAKGAKKPTKGAKKPTKGKKAPAKKARGGKKY